MRVWEEVSESGAPEVVDRFEVPGGWLYRVRTTTYPVYNNDDRNGQVEVVTVTFVPNSTPSVPR